MESANEILRKRRPKIAQSLRTLNFHFEPHPFEVLLKLSIFIQRYFSRALLKCALALELISVDRVFGNYKNYYPL